MTLTISQGCWEDRGRAGTMCTTLSSCVIKNVNQINKFVVCQGVKNVWYLSAK